MGPNNVTATFLFTLSELPVHSCPPLDAAGMSYSNSMPLISPHKSNPPLPWSVSLSVANLPPICLHLSPTEVSRNKCYRLGVGELIDIKEWKKGRQEKMKRDCWKAASEVVRRMEVGCSLCIWEAVAYLTQATEQGRVIGTRPHVTLHRMFLHLPSPLWSIFLTCMFPLVPFYSPLLLPQKELAYLFQVYSHFSLFCSYF